MANYIKGKNVVVSMETSPGVYHPVFCAKEGEVRRSREPVECTSVNSTVDREYVPGMRTTTITLSGITTIDNSNNRVSIFYLLQHDGDTVSLKLTMTADDATDLVITCDAIMPELGFNRSVNGYSNSDVQFLVSGAITFDEVLDPPPAGELESTIYLFEADADLTVGSSTAHSDLLEQAGVEIVLVARNDATHYYTNGTPGSLQFTTDLPNGDIIFSSSLPFSAGEMVLIVYKIV